MLNRRGFSRATATMTPWGAPEETRYFGPDDAPVEVEGAVRERNIYDPQSRALLETQRFNARGDQLPAAASAK